MKRFITTLLTSVATFAACTFAAAVFAQEFDAKELLERMSAEIAGLTSFRVQGEAYTDARLAAGQIIEHSSQVTLRLRRPGSIHITNRSAEPTEDGADVCTAI